MVDKNLASMYVYRTALAWLRCREFSRSNPACCALALSKAIEFLCVSLDTYNITKDLTFVKSFIVK